MHFTTIITDDKGKKILAQTSPIPFKTHDEGRILDETIFDEGLPHSPNMLSPPLDCRENKVNYFVPSQKMHIKAENAS